MLTSTPWIRLSVHARTPSPAFVGYLDSNGRAVTPPGVTEFLGQEWNLIPDPVSLWWSTRSTRALFNMISSLPLLREGVYPGRAVPIAILVEAPPEVQTEVQTTRALEERIRALLQFLGVSDERYTLATAVETAPVTNFRLPFTIGLDGFDPAALTELLQSTLRGISADDLDRAFKVESVVPVVPSNLDILVTRSSAAWPDPKEPGPRLVVLTDSPDVVPIQRVPAGSSLVALPPSLGGPATMDMTRRLVWGFTHDWPLHEAVDAATRRMELTDQQRAHIRLVTSPAGLDGFRLGGAFEEMRQRASTVIRYQGINLEPVQLPGTRAPVDEAVMLADQAVAEFKRESDGFTEIVQANAALDRAEADLGRLSSQFQTLPPAVRSQLEKEQDRRVAIWLTHDPKTMTRDRVGDLGRNSVLGQGRRYLVNVGIGLRPGNNLVPAETPTLDPILPPSNDSEYKLTVTIFSANSKVLDRPSKPLLLGRTGATEPITFLIEMPRRRRTTQLRVVVYYRGHILQSFNITARLAAREAWSGGELKVGLEFSRRDRLDAFDTVPERFSLVTNDDPGGAHALMFESGERLVMDDDTARNIQENFQLSLSDVRKKLGRQSALSDPVFADILRQLAERGSESFMAVWAAGSQELSERTAQLTNGSGQTIQILRTKPGFAYPWAGVYDWQLPRPEARAKAPVCLGSSTCHCTSTTAETICVNGFWGVRHIIEEMLVPAQIHVSSVQPAAARPAVVCTVGTRDNWSKGMVGDLVAALGAARVEDLSKKESLLDRIWDESARPAVVVVLGHLEVSAINKYETEHPRITVQAAEGYLDNDRIIDTQRFPEPRWWKDPQQPIVLLLGCNTARSGLGIVHNFVQNLAKCGASTIIATEEIVDTREAQSVALAVIPLLDTVGPGEALRTWRARELANRNPLGFLFTCFGSADVRVPSLRTELGREI